MQARLTKPVGAVIFTFVLVLGLAASATAQEPPQFSAWTAPVNLGSTVNSASGDFFSFITRDGLSLYFTVGTCNPHIDGCPDGYGGWDIFVSQRTTVNDEWGPPQNLGPEINTAYNEGSPSISADGHLMYFASDRQGGWGGNDLYVSRRHNRRDDLGWQRPENLGNTVNSSADEASPEIFEDDITGKVFLYFDSNRTGGPGPFTSDAAGNGNDIYVSEQQGDGTFGFPTEVAELNTTSADRQVSIRRDGLELFLVSNRSGTFGGLDLWVSTRPTIAEPWSTPVNLGAIINSSANDAGPAISFDGTVLYMQSARAGGYGAFDLFLARREKVRETE